MSDIIIDARRNPHMKNLGNRRRLLRRIHKHVREAVAEAIDKRSIKEASSGASVTISRESATDEPSFTYDRETGTKRFVMPGNRTFTPGDRIKTNERGSGGGGKTGANSGEGIDPFQFLLTRDEFLEIFFGDLELPDLVKKDLQDTEVFARHRAGFSRFGMQINLDIRRTMTTSMGRHKAFGRPSKKRLEKLKAQIEEMEARMPLEEVDAKRLEAVRGEYEKACALRKAIPYIDPSLDVRYRRFEPTPSPATKAVMFCLMDVSGSMGEREKDLAKRFFLLLYLFLEQTYREKVEVVFVRHTHLAAEVDEETFFYSTETGGTVVGSALKKTLEIIADRYSPSNWNIYVAQASDGDNHEADNVRCSELLEELLPLVQYYAYIEIVDDDMKKLGISGSGISSLWKTYQSLAESHRHFVMKCIATQTDIYPVFRELFKKEPA